MVDYDDSTQLNKWLFQSTDELELCRARANNEARTFLTNSPGEEPLLLSSETAATPTETQPLPVKHFAYGFRQDLQTNPVVSDSYREGPLENDDGHAFLTPVEEATLVSFYASKLPSLIGPNASVSRLRRESKVPATAALLYRRFFLSNSVLLYDPKVIMVAAAFLGSKVEDATADVRYLEEGTALMNAPVSQAEIIPAELNLLSGTYFDLLCFHPYKTVLALTEDLRTYLKSDKGQALVSWPPTTAADDDDVNVPAPLLSGQDLKPMYEAARALVDDCVVSDIPLLYTPGQVGLAALMVAQAELLVRSRGNGASNQKSRISQIDLEGYVRQRFDTDETREISMDTFLATLRTLQTQLQGLREGQLGCYNNPSVIDMQALKAIHKKLKKVRAWGTSGSGGKSEKKKKKRGSPAGGGTANAVDSGEPERKKMKASGAQ